MHVSHLFLTVDLTCVCLQLTVHLPISSESRITPKHGKGHCKGHQLNTAKQISSFCLRVNAIRKKTVCATIILDGNLNRSTQPPPLNTHIHTSFLHSENTLLCGCHSNPRANNSPKPFLPQVQEAGDKNCPNQICLAECRFPLLLPRHAP